MDGSPVPSSPLSISKADGTVGKFRPKEHPNEVITELSVPDEYQ